MLVGEVETDDNGEVELEVGGKISSRDEISGGKYVKYKVYPRIDARVD